MNTSSPSPRADNRAHVPVLLDEVLGCLSPRAGEVVIDGTFGAGGYTRAILDAAPCVVHAIDRDPSAIARAESLAAEYPGRLFAHEGTFGDMRGATGLSAADAVVLDIGVSSMQIDDPARGFSFQKDGPLDMRMSGAGLSAADVVNDYDERDIADILFHLGDERASRRIARRIVEQRAVQPFRTTAQLARAVHDVLPMHGGMKMDTATKTFQALRIHVNDELGELTRALGQALEILKPGGRLAVVTFHSLEDSIVKAFFRARSGRVAGASRHLPGLPPPAPADFKVDAPRGVAPSEAEVARNPRSRSARLRWGVRLSEGGRDA